MNDQPSTAAPNRDVLAGGRFHPAVFVLWLLAATLLGAVVACLARDVESHVRPLLLLFPLLVGVVLGALNVGLMRSMQMGNRTTAILGVVLSAAVAVFGQHYLDYRRAASVARDRISAMPRTLSPTVVHDLVLPPASFADYLRQEAARGRPITRQARLHGWAAWLSWVIDGLLTLAAALAMVVPAARLPYCSACGTWYRTIRGGRVSQTTAQSMAAAAGIEMIEPGKWLRYRLSCCRGGCGPTSLVLSWDSPARGGLWSAEAWLDAAQRLRMMQALDEVGETAEPPPTDDLPA